MPIYRLGPLTPVLPESGRYLIAPDAHVIGNVELGDEVSIWFGAVLRGDNEPIVIGPRSNIQERSILHTDPGFKLAIGAGCTIGHGAIVHGAVIGENCLIGMGATLLNGARIGANSIVGANALVTEGKAFPENSLIIGAPARVVRTLDEAEIAGIRASSAIYVSNFRRFAGELERID